MSGARVHPAPRAAPAEQRAAAAGTLARAYLGPSLSEQNRIKVEAALTAMLDDPSPLVRLALAEALAASPQAPRPMVLALAHDHSAIAALVLCRSPVLTDGDLVDCAALGDGRTQTAIALRPRVSAAVAGALAEVAAPEAVVELLRNPGAKLAGISLRRIAERLAERPEVRQALLARGELPAAVRSGSAGGTAALAAPATRPGRPVRSRLVEDPLDDLFQRAA